jgi:DNA transformation protein
VANSRAFIDHVLELARPAGRADARPMFGGHGIYIDGRIVAIVVDDLVYLKSDDETMHAFEARGLPAFEYASRDGKRTMTSYRLAPDEALESAEAMREWMRLAQEAALRAAARKPRKRKEAATPVRRRG